MKHLFTQQHLISYLYNECSLLEKAAIELALMEDKDLALQFRNLKESQKTLITLNVMPDLSTLQNILNYSKSNRFEKTH
jgi:hypothetical protein